MNYATGLGEDARRQQPQQPQGKPPIPGPGYEPRRQQGGPGGPRRQRMPSGIPGNNYGGPSPYGQPGSPPPGGKDENHPHAGETISCQPTESFVSWLAQAKGALAITTYQAGKVALVGWDGKQVTMVMRQFEKPMGFAVGPNNRLALATRHDLMLFANGPLLASDYLENEKGRYDTLFLPRASYHTGDLATHDLAFGDDGLWLVNTRFSCLSQLSNEFNFVPKWQPKFITMLAPEDRCHLNGLAMRDNKPAYVTALGETDTVGGWRPTKATGGIIMDVAANEVITRGLCMPHSPRWYDGKLWVLDSGKGEMLQVDPKDGKTTVVTALPGFLRGLSFAGPFALIGMGKIREKHIFGGLPVGTKYPKLLCGVSIVDLRSGKEVANLEFTSGCVELYDVQFLKNVFKPNILNLLKPQARQAFVAPDFSYWLRPSNVIQDDAPGVTNPQNAPGA